MNKKSRTEYSAINSSVAVAARVSAILLGYIARVVFTHTLNEDYVGINGLFGNILNILSISELGVGTAITFALYKPIAEDDIEKQKSLMLLFKRFYFFVGSFVLVAGLCVIPFLDLMMKNTPDVDHLIFLYVLFLINSVLSYAIIYKRTLIDAHQMNYISVIIQTSAWAAASVLQIIFLLVTKNFAVYLIIMIAGTLTGNIMITIKANKMFPFLKDKNVKKLSKEEMSGIVKNIKGMLFHKAGEAMVNNTDNILISALVSTVSVGLYSNYYLVIGSVRQVLNQMFQGITASVGNLGALENDKHIRKVYEASFFLAQWVFGLFAICMFQALDAFVGFSFGEKYVFTKEITLILCINFYLLGIRQPTLIFRDTMGLFWYDRYKSIAEAIINLAASVILGRIYGVFGIFLGTFIGTVTTSLWIEPFVLYRKKLHFRVSSYYGKLLIYILVFASLFYLENLLCSYIGNENFLFAILRAIICFVITNVVFLVIYGRTPEFRMLKEKGLSVMRKKRGKGSVKNDDNIMTETEETVAELAKRYFKGEGFEGIKLNEKNIPEITDLAKKHSILPLLSEGLSENENVPGNIKQILENESSGVIINNYRLLFASRDIIGVLKENGIGACVLKGVYAASFFRTPELRKSSDTDILIEDPERLEEAIDILCKNGFTLAEKQVALHHAVLHKDNLCTELHTMLAEPFDNKEINDYMRKEYSRAAEHTMIKDCMGVELPVLDDAYNAYELLLHMLQHFLREGFGLKMLLDWCFVLNREWDEKDRKEYLRLVRESRIKGFSDTVTLSCVRYLGLDKKKVEWMDTDRDTDAEGFFLDVIKAGEFGRRENNRMVALRGQGIFDYVREFHHQMHLNFPKGGKVFIIWPILWTATLIRFLNNNRTVRGVSAGVYIKTASERSKLVKEMRIFKH